MIYISSLTFIISGDQCSITPVSPLPDISDAEFSEAEINVSPSQSILANFNSPELIDFYRNFRLFLRQVAESVIN